MKKFIPLLLLTPLLFGCTSEKPYTGQKIVLDYVEEGTLVDSSVTEMKEVAFEQKIDSIFYIGDDDCSACLTLKQDIAGWCKLNHANVYYIHYSEVSQSDLSTLIDITEGYYQWSEEASIPATYLMMMGEIIFRGDSTNTLKYLNRYIEVNNPTSSANQ